MPDAGVGLAEYVRTRRLRAGLTQDDLAERAGLTVDTIGALERGLRRRLYPHTARAIADALGLADAERADLADLARGPERGRGVRRATDSAATAAPPPAGTAANATASSGAASTPVQEEQPASERPPHNLPASLTRLIGRERELAQIAERLTRTRMLTLTGPGGTGKTRLALEAAQAALPHYPDGVWFVELASLREAALVLGAVAAVAGVREAPGQPLLSTLTATMRERHLLLVLDNCEQVLEAAPEIAALLRACPGLRVLATSRAPLHIYGEQEIQVPPLATPSGSRREAPDTVAQYAAVQLFVERAVAVKMDFALTPDNAAAVAAICARLDGLPLALELAAARVKLFPPRALLSRLDQRLGFLTGGPQDRPERQRTLRAAIAWSYELLSEPEQALFRRLGVFAGGFTLEAAEAVCGADPSFDLIDTLSALVDKSLVREDDALSADDGEPRFTMLETIRDYALDQMAHHDDAAHWHARHMAYYLALMEQAEQDLQETAPPATVLRAHGRLVREYGDLRAALGRAVADGRSEDALRLAGSLCDLWVPAGNLRVARRWLEQPAGMLFEAGRWLEQALAITPSLPNAVRAKALYGLGRVLLFQWDNPEAEHDAAIRAFEQSLAIYRALDDRAGMARCLLDLGWAVFDQQDLRRAATLFEESLALCRAAGDPVGTGWSLIGLGRIALAQGDEQAGMLFDEGLAEQQRAGNQLGMVAALDGLGLLHQARGDFGRAVTFFEQAVEMRRAVGVQSGLPIALQRLAVLRGTSGDQVRAATLMRECLALSRQMDNPYDIANSLLIYGGIAANLGRPVQGARLFGAGEALIEARRLVLPEAYRGLYARTVAGVRAALGEDGFAAAFAAGRALGLDAAVGEALAIEAGTDQDGQD